jgi:hypothetical protein
MENMKNNCNLNETPSVRVSNFRQLPNLNLTVMQTSHDWNHTVLQRLIIVFLGLLTLGVLFNSCSTGHGSCAAYDQVQVEEVK